MTHAEPHAAENDQLYHNHLEQLSLFEWRQTEIKFGIFRLAERASQFILTDERLFGSMFLNSSFFHFLFHHTNDSNRK